MNSNNKSISKFKKYVEDYYVESNKKVISDIEKLIISNTSGKYFKFGDYNIEYIDYPGITTPFFEIFIDEEYFFYCKKEQPVILDCGSNIGLSILYYKLIYPNSKIIAFEPDIQINEILKRNIKRNNLTNIEVNQVALSEKEGKAIFYHSEIRTMAGSLTSRMTHEEGEVSTYEVPVEVLSKYIDKYDVDFIKLDIEGTELKVLREAGEKLRKIPFIFCEFHEGPGVEDNSLVEILQIFEENGFDIKITQSFRARQGNHRAFTRFFGKNTFVIWAKNKNIS
ncbi:MAG: FkbM family methyltransferase [Arcobacter sp.]|uniref:FkbM family methyltransferase n=1 Tax=Arcobacter sp. TaxID=1872629 RepID=UPI003C729A21